MRFRLIESHIRSFTRPELRTVVQLISYFRKTAVKLQARRHWRPPIPTSTGVLLANDWLTNLVCDLSPVVQYLFATYHQWFAACLRPITSGLRSVIKGLRPVISKLHNGQSYSALISIPTTSQLKKKNVKEKRTVAQGDEVSLDLKQSFGIVGLSNRESV